MSKQANTKQEEVTAVPMGGEEEKKAETTTETPQEASNEFSPEVKQQLENYFMTNPNISAYVEKKISEGIQEGIQNALKGTPPKANTTDPTEQERANFSKMTYKERLNLFHSNPQVYKKLAGGN